MFARDQPEIGEYARRDPDGLLHVQTFVLATIQQRLDTVPAIMRDIKRNGQRSQYLWGFKREAYAACVENREATFNAFNDVWQGYANPHTRRDELLRIGAGLHGFGLVKGGFLVQLIYGQSGCIDTHNLALYEVDPRRVKASTYKAAKPKRQQALIKFYHDTCDDVGGTEFLWNNWCEHVAYRTNSNLYTPDEVSRVHVTAIKGMKR